jgi:hypothetical protein
MTITHTLLPDALAPDYSQGWGAIARQLADMFGRTDSTGRLFIGPFAYTLGLPICPRVTTCNRSSQHISEMSFPRALELSLLTTVSVNS